MAINAKKREIVWGDCKATLGDHILPDLLGIEVTADPKTVTHKQGESGGDVVFMVGRSVKGKLTWNALSAELYAALTGGTLTVDVTKTVVRRGDEGPHTITTNIITLAQTYTNIILSTVELFGANGTVFKKVDSLTVGNTGEFTLTNNAGAAECTFNTVETDTVISPQYSYADTSGGAKVTVGKYDVPSQMAFWGRVRSKDANSVTGAMSDMFIHLTKINLISQPALGASDAENTQSYEVEFSAIVDDASDFETYFGAY